MTLKATPSYCPACIGLASGLLGKTDKGCRYRRPWRCEAWLQQLYGLPGSSLRALVARQYETRRGAFAGVTATLYRPLRARRRCPAARRPLCHRLRPPHLKPLSPVVCPWRLSRWTCRAWTACAPSPPAGPAAAGRCTCSSATQVEPLAFPTLPYNVWLHGAKGVLCAARSDARAAARVFGFRLLPTYAWSTRRSLLGEGNEHATAFTGPHSHSFIHIHWPAFTFIHSHSFIHIHWPAFTFTTACTGPQASWRRCSAPSRPTATSCSSRSAASETYERGQEEKRERTAACTPRAPSHAHLAAHTARAYH
jgi:hypothetical protein